MTATRTAQTSTEPRASECRLAIWGLLVLLFAGCGYTLKGRGSFLPESIRIIGVPPFESLVPRAELVERLTQEVTREFISRGGYRIVPERVGADAVLDGTVTGLVETPISFDDQGRATRSLLTISAMVTMRETSSDKILYESPSFQFRSEIELDPDGGDFFQRESAGIDEIARDFARTLVATIVEGF